VPGTLRAHDRLPVTLAPHVNGQWVSAGLLGVAAAAHRPSREYRLAQDAGTGASLFEPVAAPPRGGASAASRGDPRAAVTAPGQALRVGSSDGRRPGHRRGPRAHPTSPQ